ncbi:MAG: Ldh family oxidoreductase [Planctomycetaceae bacterium]|nr:Ldh family oxidoreductase [Planctomycetaceae bacterium]
MTSLVPVDALRSFIIKALASVGQSEADASTTADALVTADAMGVFTHGSKLLAGYIRRLQGGGYRANGTPLIEREGPAWAVVDGDSALGQIGGMYSIGLAMQKARQSGVAFVGLRNTGHIGAAGYFAVQAARAGFIAMVTGNDMPSVAAPGSRGPVLGSNPIAYGIPVPGGNPILLDMATSAVAGGKVYAAHSRGEPIPPTWLIDSEGHPTTDGSLYPHHSSLAPMAGHKGYGIGLWCEILSAILPGGMMTWQVGSWIFDSPEKPSRHNASFVVLDVGAIAAEGYEERIGSLMAEIHAVPTADGVDRVLLPGEREWNNHANAQSMGIPLPPDVVEKLSEVSRVTSTPPVWQE